jgi:hypothetical protein
MSNMACGSIKLQTWNETAMNKRRGSASQMVYVMGNDVARDLPGIYVGISVRNRLQNPNSSI